VSRNLDLLNAAATRAQKPGPESVPHPGVGANQQRRNQRAAVEDEITKLVQRLFLLADAAHAPSFVAFCGAEQGAGCSWVCARTAEVLAEQTPGTICLIDANLRSPSLHEHFHVERGAGFADALRDSRPVRELTRRTWHANLSLLTAGTVGEESNGALHPDRLRALFSELRREFNHVLMDTPPVGSHADATLLGQLTDGVVLVIGSNSTRRETARAAKESLEAAKVPMLGAVLNRRTFPIPQALYERL